MTLNDTEHQEYFHYDKLIWQLPIWCTAIFTLAFSGLKTTDNELLNYLAIDSSSYISTLLLLLFSIIFALSHVLHRFRMNQTRYRNRNPICIIFSGQFYLNLIVTTEACVFLFMFLYKVFYQHECIALFITVFLITFTLITREYRIKLEWNDNKNKTE